VLRVSARLSVAYKEVHASGTSITHGVQHWCTQRIGLVGPGCDRADSNLRHTRCCTPLLWPISEAYKVSVCHGYVWWAQCVPAPVASEAYSYLVRHK
jgi:hypothetical protein